MPPRWVRLLALLLCVTGVAGLFYLGAKPFAGGLFPHPYDKVVHLVVYGGIATLVWVMIGGKGRLADHGAVIIASAIGVVDEGVQRVLPMREASMADLYFDLIGAGLAVALLVTLRARTAHRIAATMVSVRQPNPG